MINFQSSRTPLQDWPETRASSLQSIKLLVVPGNVYIRKYVRDESQVQQGGSPQPPRVALTLQNCSVITAVNRFLFLSPAPLVGWQLCPCPSLIGLLLLCALRLSLEKLHHNLASWVTSHMAQPCLVSLSPVYVPHKAAQPTSITWTEVGPSYHCLL